VECDNGQRIETYPIPMPAGSGRIVVNGAAGRLPIDSEDLAETT